MRIHAGIGLAVALCAALAGALPALAAELKSSDVTQDGKRVTLHLRFSAAVKYELVAHYAKNQVILHVEGLKLSKTQLKSGIAVKGNLSEAVNGIALDQPAGQSYGEIRIQLQKGYDPGDAQVIPRDSVIDIQFLVSTSADAPAGGKPASAKPASKPADKPAAKPEEPAAGGWTPPAVTNEPLTTLTGQRFDSPLTIAASAGDDPIHIEDEEGEGHYEPDDSADTAPPVQPAASNDFLVEPADSDPPAAPLDQPFSPEELAGFSGMSGSGQDRGDAQEVLGQSPSAPLSDEPVAGLPADAQLDSVTSVVLDQDQLQSQPAPASQPVLKDQPDFTPGPSYRQRDLAQVAVNQREFRGLPFREALLELVAGTGFNVVVGPGIDNETVYLNFKQQELSLKSALEILCSSYELAYSVKDDAITITRQ